MDSDFKWWIGFLCIAVIFGAIGFTIYNVEVEKTNQKAMELGYVQEVSDWGKVIWVKDSEIVPLKGEVE